jgi:hypothetical protein
MIIKNGDLNETSIKALNELLKKDLPTKIAFNLISLARTLSEILQDKNQVEAKILEKYSQPSPEGGNQRIIPNEYIEQYSKEMEELNSIKHDLKCDKLNIDDLTDIGNIKPITLGSLMFLFDNENIEYSKVEG